MDGNAFIGSATQKLLSENVEVDITRPLPRYLRNNPEAQKRERTVMKRPHTFNHYILNLPASALTFLHSFRGVYKGQENLFFPVTEIQLPLVHVYCFNSQAEDVAAYREICTEISRQLAFDTRPATSSDEGYGAVSIIDVRDVAPNKRMFCATFRLPAEVAFSTS